MTVTDIEQAAARAVGLDLDLAGLLALIDQRSKSGDLDGLTSLARTLAHEVNRERRLRHEESDAAAEVLIEEERQHGITGQVVFTLQQRLNELAAQLGLPREGAVFPSPSVTISPA